MSSIDSLRALASYATTAFRKAINWIWYALPRLCRQAINWISNAVGRLCGSELQEKDQQEKIEKARKELGIDDKTKYYIAVVGHIGAGKSSLINGLRKLKDTDPGAAPIEYNAEMKKYDFPQVSQLVLCEIPGAGAPGQSFKTYFDDHKLYAFDCFLVVSAERFMEVDMVVATQSIKLKKPCIFVRTKADQAVKSILHRKKTTVMDASAELRQQVNKSFEENLKATGIQKQDQLWKLFIVSAWAFLDLGVYVVKDDKSLSASGMDETKCLDHLSNLKRI